MLSFNKYFHIITLSPLFLPTCCFIIGIVWYTALTSFLIIFLLLLLSSFIISNKKYLPSAQLVLCSFFICAGAWLHQKELKNYNDFYIFTQNKPITISGTIIDRSETISNYKKVTVITLAIDTIATEDNTIKSNKLILFYIKSNNNLIVGDTVTFFDISCKRPANESFQKYQIKEQVIATIFQDTPKYIVSNHPEWSWRYWIWSQKKRILEGVQSKLSSNGFLFFSSLFLGNRACIKESLEETNEQFKIWGISHFLARSGLHLALFVYIWQTIFCIIPLPIVIKQIIMSLLSCVYFVLTWTSAPFTRSFALFMLNKFCFFIRIPFNLLHYLTLVCFGFLLYCPLYIFFLDFQLSFVLTFALAWFNQVSTEHASK